MRPEDAGQDLPVCIALHGRGETAEMFVDLGVPDVLTSLVNYQGVPPFAVVAVNGGDSYWIARDAEDDPQRMLTEEVPAWLAERGLAPNPFGVLGISMGGYGALNYAAGLLNPLVAVLSPALFLTWPEADARDVFADEQQWRDTDPLQNLADINSSTLGVWCGESDPFVDGARQLIERAAPAVAEVEPGDHDADYWRKVLPDALRFVGGRIG